METKEILEYKQSWRRISPFVLIFTACCLISLAFIPPEIPCFLLFLIVIFVFEYSEGNHREAIKQIGDISDEMWRKFVAIFRFIMYFTLPFLINMVVKLYM